MKVRMSKMDSLLIYTQRREKRTVTMKLRSCDLSIIFFLAAPHSTPWMLSKSPGLPPHQLGSLSNLRRFDALIPLFDELRPRKPHWGSGRSIYGCDEHTVERRVFNMTVLFLIFTHTSLTHYSRLVERMTHLDAFCFPPSSDKPPSLIVNVLSVDLK